MARSHSIYVVVHPYPYPAPDHIIAAFTVKHELVEWWERCTHPSKGEFDVWRLRDGGGKTTCITEEFSE